MRLEGYAFRGATDAKAELALHNRQLADLRWLYVGILGLAAIIPAAIAHRSVVLLYVTITILMLLVNMGCFVASRVELERIRYYQVLAAMQIALDLGLATTVNVIQGGVTSRAVIVYVIPLLVSGLLFGARKLVYVTAVLSAVSYSTVLLISESHHMFQWSDVLVPMIFYSTLFFVIVRIMIYFSERALSATKDRAYDELFALLTHQLRHPNSAMSAIIDAMESDKKSYFEQVCRTLCRSLEAGKQ